MKMSFKGFSNYTSEQDVVTEYAIHYVEKGGGKNNYVFVSIG